MLRFGGGLSDYLSEYHFISGGTYLRDKTLKILRYSRNSYNQTN